MQITVQAKHISDGRVDDANNNPIALAINDTLNESHTVVNSRKIHTVSRGVINTPEDVRLWIAEFNADRVSAKSKMFVIEL